MNKCLKLFLKIKSVLEKQFFREDISAACGWKMKNQTTDWMASTILTASLHQTKKLLPSAIFSTFTQEEN